ncbi:MAG: hypothetical protein EOP88_00530 [Verrucomicrobiaceae bacterium]|nr:MAG: hypothetical protein EOP88_00530 [Verrucomicrobiaceae bacterium]
MPYQQRALRQVSNHFITYHDVCVAHTRVCGELQKLGFWNERLEDIQVWWVSTSFDCYGWYHGDIHIPAISGAQLSDLVMGRRTRLTDVLRHEWAHALADHWPELIASKRFVRTFGAPYESSKRLGPFDPVEHLTVYASASACEDFAEVFHFYLRHSGRLPSRLESKPAIVRKWDFVRWMASRIQGSR